MIENLDYKITEINKNYTNTRDHSEVIYKIEKNPKTVIQWCRRNFGERGNGWDFSGGKNVNVIIWSKKLITMWELWQK